MKSNFLSTAELTEADARYLLDATHALATGQRGGMSKGAVPPLLQGRTIVNLFFESSTRTRSSFEVATRRLGGAVLNFSPSTSSIQKGETLIDTAKTIEAMQPHCLVVRHHSAGSPWTLAKSISVPIINAGDGFHEHPTQALLDAFTIEEKLGTLEGKRVVIVGDIAHSRVARSNIHLLKKLGASVAVCAPPTLLPPRPDALGVDWSPRLEPLLKTADVVMALRIQFERQNRMQIPSVGEYVHYWGLDRDRVELLKPGAIILHPGPMNRGVEIDPEVADSARSVVLDQIANGVLVRMAVLAYVCNPRGLKEFVQSATTIPKGAARGR